MRCGKTGTLLGIAVLSLLLAASGAFAGRAPLDVEALFSSFEVLDNENVAQKLLPEGLFVEVRQPKSIWFSWMGLPKNAAFRNRFTLNTEISTTQDWPRTGLCMGNGKVQILLTYFHPKGIVEISTRSEGVSTVLARDEIYPPFTPPFKMVLFYDAGEKRVEAWVNDRSLSASGKGLTALASISQAALATETVEGHHSCEATYSYLKLFAE